VTGVAHVQPMREHTAVRQTWGKPVHKFLIS